MDGDLLISEIFLSLQGEGTRAGRPCAFVRLAGCDVGCRWCDTPYAHAGGTQMSRLQVLGRVDEMDCPLVEVTGGEPLIQPAVLALMRELCDDGREVLLETSGTRDIAPVDERVVRIMDVKCPASGVTERMHWANLDQLRGVDEVKFVLADRADYDFAREILTRHELSKRCTVLMGAVSDRLSPAKVAEWILADGLDVRLNLQWHKILYPDKDRGV